LLQDYHSSKEKFSKTDYFILIFEHENPEKLKEFHHQFSETLVHEKIDIIEKQLSHVKESISFFKQYAPLYYGSEVYQNILNEAQKDKWLHPEGKKRSRNLKEKKASIVSSALIDVKSLYYRIRDQKLSRFSELPNGNFIAKDGKSSLQL